MPRFTMSPNQSAAFADNCATRDNILLLLFELFYGRNDRIRLPALTHHIRFLANQYEFSRDDVTPFGPATIQKLPVLEFALRTQVIFRQCFGVRFELLWLDGFASNAVEDLGYSRNGIAVVGRNRLRFSAFSWPTLTSSTTTPSLQGANTPVLAMNDSRNPNERT